ncbi:MAG: phosphatase PAP2 family protein [Phycisphaerae bacterium]|nr:phosphatase PAP2 family protein [Phycisphaerae bacterium]NUQ46811.1 phosphatase PAP2 family protein [Phycisphaerae bacterium]
MSTYCFRRLLPAFLVPLAAGCSTTAREAPSELPDRLSRLEKHRLTARPSAMPVEKRGLARPVAKGSTVTNEREGPLSRKAALNTAKPAPDTSFQLARPDPREGLTVPRQPKRDDASGMIALYEVVRLGVLWQDEPQAGSQPTDFAAGGPVSGTSGADRRPLLPRFWDTVERDLHDLPADLWRDTQRVYGSPANLVILGVSYGGALALQQTGPDATIESHYNRSHSFKEDWRDAFGAAGNPGTHFALAGIWYLAGQQGQDEKTYEVGKTLFSALTINGLSVLLGQAATYDRSPNGERGTFPSGHTSSSFVVASVLHEAYGPWVGVPLYGLAGLVAVERLDSGEHYFSDVAFGAVMGMVIGHSVASGRDPEFFGWRLVPYADPATGTTGLALHKSF